MLAGVPCWITEVTLQIATYPTVMGAADTQTRSAVTRGLNLCCTRSAQPTSRIDSRQIPPHSSATNATAIINGIGGGPRRNVARLDAEPTTRSGKISELRLALANYDNPTSTYGVAFPVSFKINSDLGTIRYLNVLVDDGPAHYRASTDIDPRH